MGVVNRGQLGAKVVVGMAVVTPLVIFFGEEITSRTELAGAAAIIPVLLGTLVFGACGRFCGA